MEYVHLGRTGIAISRLALGTRNFGPFVSQDEATAILDHAIDCGINVIDTADSYGPRGRSEEMIGHWLAQDTSRRETVILATKVFAPTGDGPNDRGLSARHIRLGCEASLRRLRTDYIDVYQMHHVDRGVSWDEIWQAMEQLVREGKILYVGTSNFAGWHIAQANERARVRHFLGLVSEQCLYNLLSRDVEMEVLPACSGYGMGVMPWSPLGAGALSGALAKADAGRRSLPAVQNEIERIRPQLVEYEALCAEIGARPASVALAWLLANPAISAPIVGPRTTDQLTQSLEALDVAMTPEVLARLDAIFPGPGPAPEAYCGF